MSKTDFKKELAHLYNHPKKEFSIVDVPPMNFLMADGRGNPNTNPQYQEIVNALYAMSYGLKFTLKAQGVDYIVPPLEGLWWVENMQEFSVEDKDSWQWTAMIMQPPQVTAPLVETVRQETVRKKELPALPDVRFEAYHEGLAVQILYIGPYADEGPTIARMHAFIDEQGYRLAGKHHEIYLGDPRRTAPQKLKTIIRQPIAK